MTALAGCLWPAALAAAPAQEVRALTGAPTRLVWIQDAGATACVFSERPTLRLMGFDTDDGQGERALRPEIARYWKPLITDDGTRVMFGDLERRTVNIVNWDGTGLRTVLTDATFEDVWTDPRDGVEWFYAKVTERRPLGTVDAIRRYRLADPKANELVWDKTPIFQFMVSGDGGAASGGGDGGNSPQGILTLPNGSFFQRAGGCWPSMAPDNSLRSWVFTGNHRSIHFGVTTERGGKGYVYTVDFRDRPGLTLRGHEEMYHPRWSNNTRFLVATAPFSEWSYAAEAKIPNHVAAGVEVYLGLFTADMKGIERWVQVTGNTHGDYWPDAWVKPPAGPPAWLAATPMRIDADDSAGEPDSTAQVFRWDSGADGNQLKDPATGAIRVCRGRFRDATRYGRHHVLDLTDGAFVPEATAQPWLDAVRASGAFAVEAMLTPLEEPSADEGVVLAFADAPESANIMLTQRGDHLTLRLQGQSGEPRPLVRLPRDQARHLIVSYAPGNLAVFVDGRRVLLTDPPTVPVAGWTLQALLMGDASGGAHNWPGLMEGVGLFGREIGASEARQRFEWQQARRAGRKADPARRVVEARLTGTCPPADPKGIAPYLRCLSVQQYEILKTVAGAPVDRMVNVAQWSVLDGRVVPGYLEYRAGQTYRLALEAWTDHPEQESERLISGEFEPAAMFYQVRETRPPAAPPVAADGNPAGTWQPVAGPADRRQLVGPVLIRGQEQPRLFTPAGGAQRDAAGQDITFEHGSLTDVTNEGVLRLGGAGSVTAIAVVAGGRGYTDAPALSLGGVTEGQGASAIAVMSVAGLELARLGSGYTGTPAVVISAPDVQAGRQATAVAEVDRNSQALARVRVTDPGRGYLRAPRVTFQGGGGSGAEVRPTLSLDEVHVVRRGAGYVAPPVVTVAGDGQGAVARAVLQRTVLRYTDPQGHACLRNTGTIDQDGAAILFDWAASQNNSGNRSVENRGAWVLRHGALIQFGSSTGRPLWLGGLVNEGTLRLLDGSCIGMQSLRNGGTLELGAGVVVGHVDLSQGDGTLHNAGQVLVAGDAAAGPAVFGLAHPDSVGRRVVENGTPDGAAKASFTIGNGRDNATLQVLGGQTEFVNHRGATLRVQPGATLALITSDNGSTHMFNNRLATLNNAGDLTLAGVLRVQGNHAGFTGLRNTGHVRVAGAQAGLERLPSSAGPGAWYQADASSAQFLNLGGGVLEGIGTFTYVNQTGSLEGRHLRLFNLGQIRPGSDQPGQLVLVNVNVRFGQTSPQAGEDRQAPLVPAGAGLLRIRIAGPASHDSLRVSGDELSGRVELVAGPTNTLDVVTAGSALPHGRYRIVTARTVSGTFAAAQHNGKSPVPYTVNYLPDAIEVVFP